MTKIKDQGIESQQASANDVIDYSTVKKFSSEPVDAIQWNGNNYGNVVLFIEVDKVNIELDLTMKFKTETEDKKVLNRKLDLNDFIVKQGKVLKIYKEDNFKTSFQLI